MEFALYRVSTGKQAPARDPPVANTLFTQIPRVVAQAPAGNVPLIDTAQQTGPIKTRSSHNPWLSPPIFILPGTARR